MKLLGICVLTASLALCQGNNAVPKFTWLKTQPQPLLKITFPDGSEDTAVLKRFNPIPVGPNEREEDVDPCIFDGYLRQEDDSYVTVTGCPLTGNFDVQFRSTRIADSMFTVTNNVAQAVPSIFGSFVANRANVLTMVKDKVIYDEDVDEVDHKNKSSDAVNPNGYILPMKIRYDDNFNDKFGTKAVNTIRRVMAQAQNIWKWRSLPAPLIFNIDANIEKISGRFVAENDIDQVAALSTDPKFNSYVYWAYRNDEPGTVGIAYFSTTCKKRVSSRTSLNEYMTNDLIAAQTVAHEIGHNMGMDHDFGDDTSIKRFDSKGRPCSGVGGVMDYYGTVDKWSTCSAEDMTKYINSQPTFCLKGQGSAGK